MALLEIKNISKFFGGLRALNSVSFSVSEGQILGLIGPNGAGKTTLFNCISGIYKPDKGMIIFDGVDITGLKPHEIAKRGIGRTFQLTQLFSGLTVLDNVIVAQHSGSGAKIWKDLFYARAGYKNEMEERGIEQMKFLGMDRSEGYKLAANLPYGAKRNLSMGIALATNPKLLLIDEPTSGMNLEEKKRIMDLIEQTRKRGVTVLVVEHDIRVVMGISDRIVVLNFGEKIAEGKPKEISENERVIEAYLGREEIA